MGTNIPLNVVWSEHLKFRLHPVFMIIFSIHYCQVHQYQNMHNRWFKQNQYSLNSLTIKGHLFYRYKNLKFLSHLRSNTKASQELQYHHMRPPSKNKTNNKGTPYRKILSRHDTLLGELIIFYENTCCWGYYIALWKMEAYIVCKTYTRRFYFF